MKFILFVVFFFFFKQKTAYEISTCLVGSEMCVRDSHSIVVERRTLRLHTELTLNGRQQGLEDQAALPRAADSGHAGPVSYTHQTLPTNYPV